MARVAAATSDGTSIDLHFGQANSFHVYEVGGADGYRFLEERWLADGRGDHAGAARLLSDVDAVLVARIGLGATAALEAAGIKAFAVRGTVHRALTGLARWGKLRHTAASKGFDPLGCAGLPAVGWSGLAADRGPGCCGSEAPAGSGGCSGRS